MWWIFILIWFLSGYLGWRIIVYCDTTYDQNDVTVKNVVTIAPFIVLFGGISLLTVTMMALSLYGNNIEIFKKVVHKAKK